VRYCVGFHWDPGSSEGSKFPTFDADFYWDPCSPEGLQSIESIRVALADCAPAYLLGLPVSWFT
jgi:hypothetical protein